VRFVLSRAITVVYYCHYYLTENAIDMCIVQYYLLLYFLVEVNITKMSL